MEKWMTAFIGVILAMCLGLATVGAAEDAQPELISATIIEMKDDGTTQSHNLKEKIKGVPFQIKSIEFQFTGEHDFKENLNDIKVMTSGIDESYKFHFSTQYNEIKDRTSIVASVKLDNVDDEDDLIYQLRKHHLYTVVFSDEYSYSFVTKGEDKDDIFVKAEPFADEQATEWDRIKGSDYDRIVIGFVDQIDLLFDQKELFENGKITLKTEDLLKEGNRPEKNPYGLGTKIKDLGEYKLSEHYDIDVSGNKLILKKKDGKQLLELVKYKLKISEETVKLKDAQGEDITNDKIEISFETGRVLEKTKPQEGETGVRVKPEFVIQFNQPVSLGDSGEPIRLRQLGGSGTEPFSMEPSESHIDGKRVELSFTDFAQDGTLLERNTNYILEIPAELFRFNTMEDNRLNKAITVQFTTAQTGSSPEAAGFASDSEGSDDIRSFSSTNLAHDGSIYIILNRDIQWSDLPANQRLENVQLYQVPGSEETEFDPSGHRYDKIYKYEVNDSGDSISYRPITEKKEVAIAEVKLLEDEKNILKVVPEMLLPTNQYQLIVEKELLEDSIGYGMNIQIDTNIWTAAADDGESPQWLGLILEGTDTPNSDGEISGTEQYGVYDGEDDKPIVLEVEGEVIPRPGTESSFSGIRLQEYHDSDTGIYFAGIEFEYFYRDQVKHTRLHLYPDPSIGVVDYVEEPVSTRLDPGKKYRLSIANNALQTRAGANLPELGISFTVEADGTDEVGIYRVYPNKFSLMDLVRGEQLIRVYGYNFSSDIEEIRLQDEGGAYNYIGISPEDIFYQDSTLIEFIIRGGSRNQIINSSMEGSFMVFIDFGDKDTVQISSAIEIEPIGRPEVKQMFPRGDAGEWYDENRLIRKEVDGEEQSFISVTFYDDDEGIERAGDLLARLRTASRIYPDGGGTASVIDWNFISRIEEMRDNDEDEYQRYINDYIFVKSSSAKEATLYIPVIELRPQTTYIVELSDGLVRRGDYGNDSIRWNFTTMATPYQSEITTGSVPENYDPDKPIIIWGDLFHRDYIQVYFNNIRAQSVRVRETDDGKKYLEVFLPSRNRLEPGIYDIIIENTDNHTRTIYGALSVVPRGGAVPEDDKRLINDSRDGQVYENIKTSENTLILSDRLGSRRTIELDLDELMGEGVRERRIVLEGRRWNSIGTLDTRSNLVNIAFHGLQLRTENSREDAEIRIGRVSPVQAQSFTRNLRDHNPVSQLIEINVDNCRFRGLSIAIPYNNGSENMRVLRYDQMTRGWQEEPRVQFNPVDQITYVSTNRPGIFVIVEEQ
ncbi:hypothetical protein GGQ84_001509 [Desulfitispora alkaliphila]|uniref:Ig-like domain-containing protein n=1 Tax=Desulfitispora alkaliphila TaxID=622674 RepID=UPI003D252C7F